MMETFYEKEEATTRSKIVNIKAGDAPSVTLVDYVEGPHQAKRHFVQQVPVNDASLLKRLLTEAKEGDEIEATVVNESRETGCTTYLADFKRLPDAEQEMAPKNGALNIARDNITHFTLPPARDTKTKVED